MIHLSATHHTACTHHASDLEAQAAVVVLSDVLCEDDCAARALIEGDSKSDGFGGVVDLGTQGLLFPPHQTGAHNHCKNSAERKRTQKNAK